MNRNVKPYENDKEIGIFIDEGDGYKSTFAVEKSENMSEEQRNKIKKHYDGLSRSVNIFGDNEWDDGYKIGQREGFDSGVIASGIALIVAFFGCKILDVLRKKK